MKAPYQVGDKVSVTEAGRTEVRANAIVRNVQPCANGYWLVTSEVLDTGREIDDAVSPTGCCDYLTHGWTQPEDKR